MPDPQIQTPGKTRPWTWYLLRLLLGETESPVYKENYLTAVICILK